MMAFDHGQGRSRSALHVLKQECAKRRRVHVFHHLGEKRVALVVAEEVGALTDDLFVAMRLERNHAEQLIALDWFQVAAEMLQLESARASCCEVGGMIHSALQARHDFFCLCETAWSHCPLARSDSFPLSRQHPPFFCFFWAKTFVFKKGGEERLIEYERGKKKQCSHSYATTTKIFC